jgi:hypothetical protein
MGRVGGPARSENVADRLEQLESKDEWWRARAQRLLVECGEKGAVAGTLEKIAQSGTTVEGRVRALWTLRGLGGLEGRVVADALKDADAQIFNREYVPYGFEETIHYFTVVAVPPTFSMACCAVAENL